MLAVAHTAGVATGGRPGCARRLRNLSRPSEPIRQDSRRAWSRRVWPGGHRSDCLHGLHRGLVVRQSLSVDGILAKPALEEIAGRRALETLSEALARRVRRFVFRKTEVYLSDR